MSLIFTMFNSVVFIDGGFLSKLNNYFEEGKYITYDMLKFAQLLSKKEGLNMQRAIYYTAPPFQSEPPSKKEE